MSVDGKMCRVCLTTQKTSRFNLIFGNNGKIAKQIYELTGLKVSFGEDFAIFIHNMVQALNLVEF